MSLEPEHEATRYKIEKGWSDEERESRWQGKTIKELCEHFDRLIRRAENDAERNKMKHRRRYARRKQQQLQEK
jgi:hypothetical protein